MTEEIKESTLEAVKSTYEEDLLNLLVAQEGSIRRSLEGLLEDPRVLPVLLTQHKDKFLGPLQEDQELMDLLKGALPAPCVQTLPEYLGGSEESVKDVLSLLSQLEYIRLTSKVLRWHLSRQEA